MLRDDARNSLKKTRLVSPALVAFLGMSCGVGYDVGDNPPIGGSGGAHGGAGFAGSAGAASGAPSSSATESPSGGRSSSFVGWVISGGYGWNLAGNTQAPWTSAGTEAVLGQAGMSSTRPDTSRAGAGGTTSSTNIANQGGTAGANITTSIVSCGMEIDYTGSRLKRKMLIRDEGRNRLAYIDVASTPNSWYVDLERHGYDFQLIGDCRVMVGTDAGYAVYDLRPPHQKVDEITSFPGTVTARRLRNGSTLLVGVGQASSPYQGSDGIVLLELDSAGTITNRIVLPGTYYVRLVRETPLGTYLVANNTRVIEIDRSGNVLSPSFTVSNQASTHAWKALRIQTNIAGVDETIVSTGNLASLVFFDSSANVRRRITGGNASIPGGANAVNPQFYSDFQILASGNIIVANSCGTSFMGCIPILEYTSDGALAWYWGDPAYAAELSAIQGVIVLDGLDPSKLHVEDTNGRQVPVNL